MLLSSQIKKIQEAKELLENHGYFIKNLWHIEDIATNYPECSEEEAQDILYDALTNPATFDHIWKAIRYEASKRGYEMNPII